LEIIEMKKTLIALAAVAATGASFAQVTMVGNIGFSWQQSPIRAADGSHVQGLSIQDGEIYITAVEDLGDGWKATARGGFTMRGRNNGIADRDATVTLATPFGVVNTGTLRSCGSLDAQKSGVVTGTVYSSNETNLYTPLDTCSLVNVLAFATKLSDFTVSAQYVELNSASATTDRGNANGATGVVVGAEYAKDALKVGFDYLSLSVANGISQGYVAPATNTLLLPLDGMTRLRMYGSYDAGVAKFAAGYQMRNFNLADQYIGSVMVPMGNLTFGLDYTGRLAQGRNSKGTSYDDLVQGVTAAVGYGIRNGDKASNSLGLGATYNFSKTTTLNFSYITYTDAATTVAPGIASYSTTGLSTAQAAALPTLYASIYGTNAPGATFQSAVYDTEYRIRLMKSF
jgi:hypothetical protein